MNKKLNPIEAVANVSDRPVRSVRRKKKKKPKY